MTRPRTRQNRTDKALHLINILSTNQEDDDDAESNERHSDRRPGKGYNNTAPPSRNGKKMPNTRTRNAFAAPQVPNDHSPARRSSRLNPNLSSEKEVSVQQFDSQLVITQSTVEQEADDDEEPEDCEESEGYGESEESEEEGGIGAESQPKPSLKNNLMVVISGKATSGNSIRELSPHHEDDYDDKSQEHEEIAESDQEDNPSEDAGSSSQSENVAEENDELEDPIESYALENATQTPRPRAGARLIDRLEGWFSPANEPSSRRKRRREPDTSESTPRRVRRRPEEPNNHRHSVSSGPPQPLEIAEWEASMIIESPPPDEVVEQEDTIYDDATKIMGLERNWDDLMNGCKKIKSINNDTTRSFQGISDICERIQESKDIYKKIQRDRATGLITPDTWRLATESLQPIRWNADMIKKKIRMRANEATGSNDFRIKADADEYAEHIYKHVVTDLSGLALECLKAHYSEEYEWLLSSGFTTVLKILEVAGEINRTLTSMQKSNLISIIRDREISQSLRVPLHLIYKSLVKCEMEEQIRKR